MIPYNSEEHAGGRLVQDAETGRWHVEWHEVEKVADGDERLVRFQKQDGGNTAVSGKKQSKNSLKRAKKDRKNRLKAEAAAEKNRENLNKGVEMKETTAVVTIAKAWIEGGRAPRITKKADFYRAMVKLAAERYPEDRAATRFAKFATSGDPDAVVLWKAYRSADGNEPATADGEASPSEHQPDADMPETSSAYDTMAAEARKLARKQGISFEVAFSRVASARPDLMKADREAHFAKVAKAYGAP
jgi:hypothetical protein